MIREEGVNVTKVFLRIHGPRNNRVKRRMHDSFVVVRA